MPEVGREGRGEATARAARLEAGYAASHRAYEWVVILATLTCGGWLLFRIVACPPLSGWWTPLAALVGLLLADFLSGFFEILEWTITALTGAVPREDDLGAEAALAVAPPSSRPSPRPSRQ